MYKKVLLCRLFLEEGVNELQLTWLLYAYVLERSFDLVSGDMWKSVVGYSVILETMSGVEIFLTILLMSSNYNTFLML